MAAAADDLTRLPRGGVGRPSSGVCELKLELIQTQMAQKPILRGEACVGRFYRAEFLEGRRFKKLFRMADFAKVGHFPPSLPSPSS